MEVRRFQNAQDAFDSVALARLGINRTDGRAVDVIERHGRITAGDLAAEAGLSSGATTTLIDRLEAAGYVRRVRDPADRRRVLVELTDEARRRAGEIWGPIAAEAAEGMAGYTDAELLFIRQYLQDAQAFLARHQARVRAMGGAVDPPGGD